MDGSGKSRHVKLLTRDLETSSVVKVCHARVAVFRLFSWPFLQFLVLLGGSVESGHPAASNNTVRRIWPWFFLVDFLTFLVADNFKCFVAYVFSKDKERFVWLLDRYYFDGVIDWACIGGGERTWDSLAIRLMRRILPTPNATLFMNASLGTLLSRKKDEHVTESYLTQRILKYEQVSRVLRMTDIDANRDFESVHADVLKVVMEALAAPSARGN